MWQLAYFLTGLAVLGIGLRLQWPRVQQAWNSDDLMMSGPIILGIVTVTAWPAVVALWVGWRLAPAVRRLGDRLSGHRRNRELPSDPDQHQHT